MSQTPTGLMLKYIRLHWGLALKAALASIVATAAFSITPLYTRMAVDELVAGHFEHVWMYAAIMISLIVVQGILSFANSYYSEYMAQRIAYSLRNDIYKHLQELSLGFYKRMDTGQLVARATSDIEVTRMFLRNAFSGFLSALLTLLISLYIMTGLSLKLTLAAFSPLPAIFILVYYFSKNIRDVFEKARQVYGDMTAHLTEVTSGLKVFRAMGAFSFLQDRFGRMNTQNFSLMLQAAKLRARTWPTVGLLTTLAVLVVLWYGGTLVIQGEISPGTLVAMATYVGAVSWPFINFGFTLTDYARSIVSLRRVLEVLSMEPEVKEAPDAIPLTVEKGEVELRNVWFSYDGKHWVLKGVSFRVEPGEMVAIVGPTGSGKSTLVHLIPRFYDPQEGEILVDGVNIKRVKLDDLRRQVAIVHQDIYIFPDTIRNNIAYGKPDATMEEIVMAAKLARLHDFIASLPNGYDTVVGEKGVTLSGGQRQRLAIARALLINPKIIILDDSTSNVDADTEKAIYDALTSYFKGKTLIIITQRPSTMRLADRIVVLEDGKVVAEGSHGELVGKSEVYAKLYGMLEAEVV